MIKPDEEIKTYSIEYLSPYWLHQEEQVFEPEMALVELLADEVVIVGGMIEYKDDKSIASLSVIANDIWFWGCSDYEGLPICEIENLWKMYKENNKWGSVWWCCKQRNMQPQKPMRDAMIKEDGYPDWMNDLGLNPDQEK